MRRHPKNSRPTIVPSSNVQRSKIPLWQAKIWRTKAFIRTKRVNPKTLEEFWENRMIVNVHVLLTDYRGRTQEFIKRQDREYTEEQAVSLRNSNPMFGTRRVYNWTMRTNEQLEDYDDLTIRRKHYRVQIQRNKNPLGHGTREVVTHRVTDFDFRGMLASRLHYSLTEIDEFLK